MIEIGNTLVSLELLEEEFVCDLSACKGACCVEGDAGAPLEEHEKLLLEEVYDKVKPYMRPEGIAAIEEQGKHILDDWDKEPVTPLVDGKECAYVSFDDNGMAKCAIEQAWAAGEIDFRKPISCHLYPVRTKKYERFEAVNYDRWKICEAACACGQKLEVKVFRFVKDALIRKYGSDWYEQLEIADRELKKL